MKEPRPLAEMRARAEALAAELAPYTTHIVIAGSIRRGKPMVADIELVAEPKMVAAPGDLFAARTTDALDAFVRDRLAAGDWRHRLDKNGRPACGPRFKRLVLGNDTPLDLFAVIRPASWGVVLLIRTGPAEFSHRLVTPREHGGYMPAGYRVADGALWCGNERVDTPNEIDVFDAIGLSYREPERRQ